MKNNGLNSAMKFTVARTKKDVLKAKRLCHDIYLQEKYIQKAYPDGIIPFRGERNAVYVVAKNAADDVVGTLRLFKGSHFQTLHVWKHAIQPQVKPFILNSMVEVGALAVNPAWQNHRVAQGLFKTGAEWMQRYGYDYALMSVDSRVLRLLKIFGWNIIRLGKPKQYMGSLTVPCILSLRQQKEEIIEETPDMSQNLAA